MENIYKQILTEIVKNDKIIIHRHKRADLDAIGSQMALKQYIQLNFPDKEIYATAEDNESGFNFIGIADIILESTYEDALVIVVDTANVERIDGGSLFDPKVCIKIDHHPNETPYGNIMLVEPDVSSTSELLFSLFDYLNKTENFIFNTKIMHSLFCGIYGDTGGFTFQNTTSNTFYALSEILKFNIPFEQTVLRLKSFDEDIIRAVGYALCNIQIDQEVGYIVFDKQFQRKHKIEASKLSIVVNFLGMFNNLKAWVVFNEHKKFIRVNLRSKHNIDISKIAMQYGGGGHKNASGAMIYEWDKMNEVVDKMKILIQEEQSALK